MKLKTLKVKLFFKGDSLVGADLTEANLFGANLSIRT
jgi:uncharacterized protein YjbI with pentapeptide repeats